jgi:hypothetical protein
MRALKKNPNKGTACRATTKDEFLSLRVFKRDL